jgi:hypothetical protein
MVTQSKLMGPRTPIRHKLWGQIYFPIPSTDYRTRENWHIVSQSGSTQERTNAGLSARLLPMSVASVS